jgi:hypothetical protein
VFVGLHGVGCLLVERHPDLLIHRRLRGGTHNLGCLTRALVLHGRIARRPGRDLPDLPSSTAPLDGRLSPDGQGERL